MLHTMPHAKVAWYCRIRENTRQTHAQEALGDIHFGSEVFREGSLSFELVSRFYQKDFG